MPGDKPKAPPETLGRRAAEVQALGLQGRASPHPVPYFMSNDLTWMMGLLTRLSSTSAACEETPC